jgi:hypothetical protein
MALEDDLDTLYACPPSEFLDRRKALAQALRKAGKKDDAGTVAGAVKPTPAAWAVNQLARRNPDEMAALMNAGERLRALVRTTFAGHADARAMAEARTAQRAVVARLTRLATRLLDTAGASSSPTVLERVAATLTTISTTGAWGDRPPSRLTRELDPPGIEALTALVGDVAIGAAREVVPVEAAVRAKAARRSEGAIRQEDAANKEEDARKEDARRAAAEVRERIERAEAALRAASAIEEQARAASERARAAVALATSEREEREVAAREARRLATAQEQAAEEARRKAEAAALAARNAEDGAAGAARAERAAKGELTEADQALARATAECMAAEEAVVRERRAAKRPPA